MAKWSILQDYPKDARKIRLIREDEERPIPKTIRESGEGHIREQKKNRY